MYRPNDEMGHRALRSLREICRRMSAPSRATIGDGLSVPSVQCLRVIEDADAHDMTVSRVAEATELARSTVSTIADRLVREGLVTRSRSKRDRRRVNLTLTDQGRTRLRELPVPIETVVLERMAALPPADRHNLVDALEQVVGMMQADEYSAGPMLTSGGRSSLRT